MNLIIVESPTKAKTLSRFLGKDFVIKASMGHIRDLPKKNLGVEVDHDFKPSYQLVAGKKEVVSELKKAAKTAQKIYLATDPDREGEAIAWHIAYLLDKKENDLARIVFHEITQSAIKKALAHPGTIDLKLVDAQQARRILDRLVGYKLSPLLWRKIRRGLSAGRVQSVAVRLIVDREREIEKFVTEEYWEIMAELRRHLGGQRPDVPSFLAKLEKINGQKVKIENEMVAKDTVDELKKAGFEVAAVEKKEVKQRPAPPFTTSTLQQKAASLFSFSSKRTMRVAQNLYEKGLITYHRTDSVALAQEAISTIRQYIANAYGQDYLPENPHFYQTKSKVAQEAHEAIRPTDVGREKAKIKYQTKDEEKLYDLIWKRAIASQMNAATWDQTKVSVQASGEKNLYLLMAEGKVIKFNGWLAVYGGVQEKEEAMPELKKDDELDIVKINAEQKFTQPPPRYSEATLIKALEERGIGRPSTYAPIVSTIQDRQYVEKIEGRFHPSPLGTTVNDFLVEYFSEIVNYEFTAQMEDNLDAIARGEKKWVPVIREFYQPFEEKLVGVTKVAERVRVPAEVTDEICPQCQKNLPAGRQGKLVIRLGKFGKFLSCSRFPECDYTAPYIPKLEGVKCPQCGGEVVIKKTKKGKQFYGCSRWPKCNWASWRKPK
jgi:DNA topoisomerase-1